MVEQIIPFSLKEINDHIDPLIGREDLYHIEQHPQTLACADCMFHVKKDLHTLIKEIEGKSGWESILMLNAFKPFSNNLECLNHTGSVVGISFPEYEEYEVGE